MSGSALHLRAHNAKTARQIRNPDKIGGKNEVQRRARGRNVDGGVAIFRGAQTLTNLKNQPPDGAYITMQMTDGTVIAQGGNMNDWWKLTPDNTGSYVNGTWTQLATLPTGYAPYAMAEAVLADGRLVISGGEYNEGFNCCQFTNQSAIYDPLKNTWSMIKPPKGWSNIGDAPSIVLPDGRFVIAFKFTTKMAALDPKTLKWTELKSIGKNGKMTAEEGWVLQPDGTFLTVDVKAHPSSELYDPNSGKWIDEGDTATVDLRGAQNCCGNCIPYGKHNQKCYDPPGETGPLFADPMARSSPPARLPTARTQRIPRSGRLPRTASSAPGPRARIFRTATNPTTIRCRFFQTGMCLSKARAASFTNLTARS